MSVEDFSFWSFILGAVLAGIAALISDYIKLAFVAVVKKGFKIIKVLYYKTLASFINRAKYKIRIHRKKINFGDQIYIASKIRVLSASESELKAFKVVRPEFTTMEEFNERYHILGNVDLQIDTSRLINPINNQ